jgi:hypothetical protein
VLRPRVAGRDDVPAFREEVAPQFVDGKTPRVQSEYVSEASGLLSNP